MRILENFVGGCSNRCLRLYSLQIKKRFKDKPNPEGVTMTKKKASGNTKGGGTNSTSHIPGTGQMHTISPHDSGDDMSEDDHYMSQDRRGDRPD